MECYRRCLDDDNWQRRLITRLVAIVPTVIVTAIYCSSGTARLLIFSQVILSMQLSFAVFPLLQFTSDKAMMGSFVNKTWLRILNRDELPRII